MIEVVPAPDDPVIAMTGCLTDTALTDRQAEARNKPRLPNSGAS